MSSKRDNAMTVRWSDHERKAISDKAEETGVTGPAVVRAATRAFLGLPVLQFAESDVEADEVTN